MQKALHGVSLWHSNVVTQLRIAKESGFEALELLPNHLYRYLDNGGSLVKYKALADHYGIKISCINALKDIGRHQPTEHNALKQEARKICHAAQALGCPVVQIMALNELDALSEDERNHILVRNIGELADIAKEYGVKLQIELVAFTRFNSLSQGLEIIKQVGRDNVGLVIDFWHLQIGGGTKPEEVARMDASLIYGVHFCDGRGARDGEMWDEGILRNYQPGEGDVDIAAWVSAVQATGYDGVWSPEQLSPTHWEDDLWQIAKDNFDSLTAWTARAR